MKKLNEKGITLIALVITIIILIVLASIGTYAAKETIESARLTKFTSELKIMQYKVNELYNSWKENRTITIDGETYGNSNNKEGIKDIDKDLGQSIGECPKSSQASEALKGKTEGNYRYFSNDLIKKLEVEDVEQDFFIDIETRSVVSCDGVRNKEDEWYYDLEQVSDSVYNVKYEPEKYLDPTFNITTEENKGVSKIIISNVEYKGYIKKWKIKYGLVESESVKNWYEIPDYWDGKSYSFSVDTPNAGTTYKYKVQIFNEPVSSAEKDVTIVIPEEKEPEETTKEEQEKTNEGESIDNRENEPNTEEMVTSE